MSTSPQVHSAASWIAKGVACGSSPGGSPAVRALPDVFVQYCGS